MISRFYKTLIISLFSAFTLLSPMVYAQGTAQVNCPDGSYNCETNLPQVSANQANVQHIFQLVFGVLGALAVIFVVLSGMKMITSQGNPQAVAQARNTLVYAVVGLIIAISAELIVSFVIGKL